MPFKIPEDGDDDIEAIEAGLEGDILVEIEAAGDDVDHDPDEPLFEVFAGEGPDADNAEGCGEGIEDGDARVGEMGEQVPDYQPDGCGDAEPDEGRFLRHVADGEVFLLAAVAHPGDEAVDGHCQIVELHAAVGIEAFLVVEHDAEALHHEADCPHPDAGFVFQQNISQA